MVMLLFANKQQPKGNETRKENRLRILICGHHITFKTEGR